MERLADLCDYLQADERMHVRLATEWIRKLAGPEEQEELVRWGRDAVARIEGFYAGDDYDGADDVKFTFQKDGARDGRQSSVIGE
jgi:rubrerythrin